MQGKLDKETAELLTPWQQRRREYQNRLKLTKDRQKETLGKLNHFVKKYHAGAVPDANPAKIAATRQREQEEAAAEAAAEAEVCSMSCTIKSPDDGTGCQQSTCWS